MELRVRHFILLVVVWLAIGLNVFGEMAIREIEFSFRDVASYMAIGVGLIGLYFNAIVIRQRNIVVKSNYVYDMMYKLIEKDLAEDWMVFRRFMRDDQIADICENKDYKAFKTLIDADEERYRSFLNCLNYLEIIATMTIDDAVQEDQVYTAFGSGIAGIHRNLGFFISSRQEEKNSKVWINVMQLGAKFNKRKELEGLK